MIYLLQLSIASIAVFVTYASVFGLGSLFTSIAYPVMAAGVALELGKYVTVSYAYQQWSVLTVIERTLLSLFVTILMAFTSGGVFSYLGQGYQESYAGLDAKKADLQILSDQLTGVQARIKTIDGQIENLPANSVSGRIRLKREYTTEREPLAAQASKLEAEVAELKRSVAGAEIHAGQISYIARITNSTVEQAATWIIAVLAICLDPFALFMTILLNKMLMLRRREREAVIESPAVVEAAPEPAPVVVATPEPEPAPIVLPPSLDTSGLSAVANAWRAPVAEPVVPVVKKPTTEKKPVAKKPVVKKPAARKPAAKKAPPVELPTLPATDAVAPSEEAPVAPFAVGIKPQRAEVNEQARTVK